MTTNVADAVSVDETATPHGLLRFVDLRGDRRADQFLRFVLAGAASNIVYGVVFLLLRPEGLIVANVVGAVVSTILANELHRRRTFRAADRVNWLTAQGEGGGIAALGMLLSTATLALSEMLFPASGGFVEVMLVVTVSAIVGAVRFLALRRWVFSFARGRA